MQNSSKEAVDSQAASDAKDASLAVMNNYVSPQIIELADRLNVHDVDFIVLPAGGIKNIWSTLHGKTDYSPSILLRDTAINYKKAADAIKSKNGFTRMLGKFLSDKTYNQSLDKSDHYTSNIGGNIGYELIKNTANLTTSPNSNVLVADPYTVWVTHAIGELEGSQSLLQGIIDAIDNYKFTHRPNNSSNAPMPKYLGHRLYVYNSMHQSVEDLVKDPDDEYARGMLALQLSNAKELIEEELIEDSQKKQLEEGIKSVTELTKKLPQHDYKPLTNLKNGLEEEAIKLRKSGMTLEQIGKVLGRSSSWVSKVTKGIKPAKRR